MKTEFKNLVESFFDANEIEAENRQMLRFVAALKVETQYDEEMDKRLCSIWEFAKKVPAHVTRRAGVESSHQKHLNF